MNSNFPCGENRRSQGSLEELETEGCDITSLTLNRCGQSGFELTVRGYFVAPTSHEPDVIPPLELPGPALGACCRSVHCEDPILGQNGGPRTTVPPEDYQDVFENETSVAAPIQVSSSRSNLELLPNGSIHANFGFKIQFSAQIEKGPLQTNSAVQTEDHDIAHGRSLYGFDDRFLNGDFRLDELGPNLNFSKAFETNQDFQMLSQQRSLSAENFNYLYGTETPFQALPDMPFYLDQLNFQDNVPISSQGSSFSSASSSSPSSPIFTTSPTTAVTTPSTTPRSIDSSPYGSICGIYNATFTRPSDLKRHEGVHDPKQRKFHCKELGCERKARKGFYRRDKLRAHERQVHGMDD